MRVAKTILVCGVLTAAGLGMGSEPSPQDDSPAKPIARFLDEETFAVLHVDLARIQVDPLADKLLELGLEVLPEADREEAKAAWKAGKMAVKAKHAAFLQAGGRDVYVVVSGADLPYAPPLVVLPLSQDAEEEALQGLLAAFPFDVKQRLGDALVLCARSTLTRLQEGRPAKRPELREAFQAGEDAAARLAFIPPRFWHRVIEEMMPELPREIGGGPSHVLTRGVRWTAVGIHPPPDLSIRVTIQSRDEQAAAALQQRWLAACKLIGQQEQVRRFVPDIDRIAALLSPKANGSRLTLRLDEGDQGIATIASALKPAVRKARAEARRASAMNNLKQIGLAMLQYHEKHRCFPAPANYDADGRPLLSWRVHLLPFQGEGELYRQFRLNEPWDSEQNRKLIDKMPAVYCSPGSRLNAEGRANYLLPVGDDTVFPGRQPRALQDVKDGAGRTIMVVEVDDRHAPVWTKPEDLAFDPEHPGQDLGGPFEGGFNALFCDGHVEFVRLPQEAEQLRAMFTATGDQPAERR